MSKTSKRSQFSGVQWITKRERETERDCRRHQTYTRQTNSVPTMWLIKFVHFCCCRQFWHVVFIDGEMRPYRDGIMFHFDMCSFWGTRQALRNKRARERLWALSLVSLTKAWMISVNSGLGRGQVRGLQFCGNTQTFCLFCSVADQSSQSSGNGAYGRWQSCLSNVASSAKRSRPMCLV